MDLEEADSVRGALGRRRRREASEPERVGRRPWPEAPMADVTIIVSRTESARYRYLRHLFGETMDVIFDRRFGQRRQPNHERAAAERRRADRRRADVARDLHTLGWALVRR